MGKELEMAERSAQWQFDLKQEMKKHSVFTEGKVCLGKGVIQYPVVGDIHGQVKLKEMLTYHI